MEAIFKGRFFGQEANFLSSAAVTGFGGLEGLVNAQVDFVAQRNQRQEELDALAPILQANRDQQQLNLSNLLTDLGGNVETLGGSFAADLRRDRLEQANLGGFNPNLRNIEREGFQNALTLLGGQAGILQRGLAGPQLFAQGLSQQSQTASLGAAQIAAAQSQFKKIGQQSFQPNPLGDAVSGVGNLIAGLSLDALLNKPGTDS